MATCNQCWEGRHCRNRAGCTCSVCSDVKMRARIAPKKPKAPSAPRRPSGPRQPRPVEYDSRPRVVKEIDPFMQQAIRDHIDAGGSIISIVNKTNLTERQIREFLRST